MNDRRQEVLCVLRAQSGETEALDALLRAVQEPLYGYLCRLLGGPRLAGDVLQDVFVLVIRKLRWLRDPEVFRPWVYRIASRQAFQCLKREHRWSALPEDELPATSSAGNSPYEPDPELKERLADSLEGISPASRAVLMLHYLEGMTLQEVADVLEISLAAVKSRLAYGLRCLRNRLRV